MSKIYVIGIGYKPLDERARAVITGSDVILASERLFGVFSGYEEFGAVRDKVKIISNVDETIGFMKASLENPQYETLTLLASGDPLFFGIGRRIVEEFGEKAVEIIPDLSSVQIAFARIREPWNDAFLMSIHGGPDSKRKRRLPYGLKDIPSLLSMHDKVAVLTDKVNNPPVIAEEILRSSTGTAITMYVCERLGYRGEKITKGTAEEIAAGNFPDPNVVIIMKRREAMSKRQEIESINREEYPVASRLAPPPPLSAFGLSEKEIYHSRGLITKDEIRAVTLHKLRLPWKGVFWDVGAGSGSISIEAARLFPGLKIFAVERDDEQAANIRINCERFDAKNIEVKQGNAPEVLENLPSPDRVFIGGSGGLLDEIIGLVRRAMPSGIIVLNAATMETLQEAIAGLEKNGFEVGIAEVSVSKSKVIAGKKHMSALNPVFIVTGEKGVL